MLTIRLFCAAGMSTSLLVSKMIEAAEAVGTEVDIIAYPVASSTAHRLHRLRAARPAGVIHEAQSRPRPRPPASPATYPDGRLRMV
jgi:hypothetical protein